MWKGRDAYTVKTGLKLKFVCLGEKRIRIQYAINNYDVQRYDNDHFWLIAKPSGEILISLT
jgi:hypothetical protein